MTNETEETKMIPNSAIVDFSDVPFHFPAATRSRGSMAWLGWPENSNKLVNNIRA